MTQRQIDSIGEFSRRQAEEVADSFGQATEAISTKRRADQRRETRRFWISTIIGILGLGAASVAAWAAIAVLNR